MSRLSVITSTNTKGQVSRYYLGITLESGIDVGQGINVGPGKFVKRRALNKHRA